MQRHLKTTIASNLRPWLTLAMTSLSIWATSSRALAVITSAPGWDYMVTPGEPRFGVNLDGVVPPTRWTHLLHGGACV